MPCETHTRIVVVDDSAYIRRTVIELLSEKEEFEVVAWARDGQDALQAVSLHKPDVVVTDLDMPNMNGIEFIRRQMELKPLPIVVLSVATETGVLAEEAISSGAIEFVSKPTSAATNAVRQVGQELLRKVQAAAQVEPDNLVRRPNPEPAPESERIPEQRDFEVVVMGLSTGGPGALAELCSKLPKGFHLPIVAVLHLPEGYPELLVKSLTRRSRLPVKLGKPGEPLKKGELVVVPGGVHSVLERDARRELVLRCLPPGEIQDVEVPSIDALFKSAAETAEDRVLACVLTGMGKDGSAGAAWVAANGGMVIAQSREDCAVYGMPRRVTESGLADAVLKLDELSAYFQSLSE